MLFSLFSDKYLKGTTVNWAFNTFKMDGPLKLRQQSLLSFTWRKDGIGRNFPKS